MSKPSIDENANYITKTGGKNYINNPITDQPNTIDIAALKVSATTRRTEKITSDTLNTSMINSTNALNTRLESPLTMTEFYNFYKSTILSFAYIPCITLLIDKDDNIVSKISITSRPFMVSANPENDARCDYGEDNSALTVANRQLKRIANYRKYALDAVNIVFI